MERTLCALQWLGSRSYGTLGELRLGRAGDSLEIVVAGVAEVGRAEAEVDGHGAAIATLVLQEVCSVFGTHLEHGQTDNSLYTLKLLHIYAHLAQLS